MCAQVELPTYERLREVVTAELDISLTHEDWQEWFRQEIDLAVRKLRDPGPSACTEEESLLLREALHNVISAIPPQQVSVVLCASSAWAFAHSLCLHAYIHCSVHLIC